MSQEVNEKKALDEEKTVEEERIKRIYNELIVLYKEIQEMIDKSDDFYEMLRKSVREVEFLDDYDEKYIFPFFTEPMVNNIHDMMKSIQEYQKELYQYRGEIYQIIRFVELLKDKLQGKLNIEDLWDLRLKVDFYGSWISIKDQSNVVLNTIKSYDFGDTTIQQFLEDAITLHNLRSAIFGVLLTLNLSKGVDIYEGKKDQIKDYIESKLRDILKLF